jgi:hypothetical protein
MWHYLWKATQNFGFILIVVEIKFTAPKIDDTPARCKEKMAKSTDAPAWAISRSCIIWCGLAEAFKFL